MRKMLLLAAGLALAGGVGSLLVFYAFYRWIAG